MTDELNLRMLVGTWNVGGKSPNEGLNLKDWLKSPSAADIYVIGFQEIVPLNAGNVLGLEDSGPASKWLTLIREALNSNNFDHSQNLQYYHYNVEPGHHQGSPKPGLSFSDYKSLEDEFDHEEYSNLFNLNSRSSQESFSTSLFTNGRRQCSPNPQRRRYCLAASKQMVGIFLCVRVRADLYHHISNLRFSCVGRGIGTLTKLQSNLSTIS